MEMQRTELKANLVPEKTPLKEALDSLKEAI